MRLLDPFFNLLQGLWLWMRRTPHLGAASLLIAVGIMLLAQRMGYHEGHLPWMPAHGPEIIKGWLSPSTSLLAFYYLMPYLKLWALLGGIVYHLVLLRSMPDVEKLKWPTWIACGFLAAWAVCNDLHDQLEYSRLTVMGEPPWVEGYILKLVMITIVCLMPAAALSYYAECKILDRFVLRSFVQPLVFCFVAICLLWVMWDMLDSLRDFQEAKTPIRQIATFYLSLVPYIFVETIWAVLLLSTLFTFTRMSRSNELISMLGSGRSLWQVMKPVFVVGLMVSFLSLAANYYWAPRAEGNRQAIMLALSEADGSGASLAQSLMYHDAPTRRTWYIGSFPFNLREGKLRGVEVFTENEKGQLTHSIRAGAAYWWPGGMWSFYHCIERTYVDGNPETQIRHGFNDTPVRLDIENWPETPWSIISSSLQPDYMSVQELVSYLKAHSEDVKGKLAAFRTQLFHRFAFPMQCLIAVIIAAPLGVSYSRRGALGGVAGAILTLIGLVFLNQLFVSMGKGMKLKPEIAVWIPHLIVGFAGVVLFIFRSRNRDLPSLSWLFQLFKRKKKQTASRRRLPV
jgi:lipopolysaccharide export system permease protein